VLVLAALVSVSFLFGLFSGNLGSGGDSDEVLPDGYGSSAIGHRAFLKLLQRMDIPVVVSRSNTASRLDDDTVLLLLEPDPADDGERDALQRMLDASRRTLLVLPKWKGVPGGERDGWIETVILRDPAVAESLLQQVDERATISRGGPASGWSPGPVSAAPELPSPQLMETPDLVELVTADEGVLVAERRERNGRRLMVLSDPDLLANHGLGRGQNAEVAVALVELLGSGATVVVDETLHGHVRPTGLMDELLSYPLVLFLLQLVLACGALLWAGVGRFGPPRRRAAAVASGKQVLIGNTVSLLISGGHGRQLLRRYVRESVERVSEAYHIPAELEPGARRERLEFLGASRGLSMAGWEAAEPGGPEDDPDADEHEHGDVRVRDRRQLVVAARRVHHWREEMLHGAGGRPRAR